VIELRFSRELYLGTAVDEAVKQFAGLAEFELVQEDDAWVVVVRGKDEKRERKVAGELGNFALGITVQSQAQEAQASEAQAPEARAAKEPS
jgi:hypothetical protein